VVSPVRHDRGEVDQVGDPVRTQRRVLVMRDVQGIPGNLVAQRLGLSAAAMKSRLHRAHAAVRADLDRPDRRGGS
jgi:DNA-directed RNA polymerase specialized sigma24 family protein